MTPEEMMTEALSSLSKFEGISEEFDFRLAMMRKNWDEMKLLIIKELAFRIEQRNTSSL